MDVCISSLVQAKTCWALGVYSGYWKVHIWKKGFSKKSYTTLYGTFHYTCMPFCLTKAFASLPKAPVEVSRKYKWVARLVYLDYKTIYSNNAENYTDYVGKIFTSLKQVKTTLKLKSANSLQKVSSTSGISFDLRGSNLITKTACLYGKPFYQQVCRS